MSKERIKVDACVVAVKKDGKGTYHKLNQEYFVWDSELGKTLIENIGKTFELEILKGPYPKVIAIYGQVTESAIEVVNCTGAAKVAQHYNVDNNEIEKALAKEFILKQDSPNSRTYGVGKDSIKIYFDTAHHLQAQIDALMGLGLMPADYSPEVVLTGPDQPQPKMTREEELEYAKKGADKLNPGGQAIADAIRDK